MKKISPEFQEYIDEQKLLGKYAGLAYQGLNEDEELEFLGDKASWDTYENIKGKDILYDEDERPYFNDDNESDEDHEIIRVYLD